MDFRASKEVNASGGQEMGSEVIWGGEHTYREGFSKSNEVKNPLVAIASCP